MPRIAIITDTDSSLPLDLAKQYNIVEIPIVVQFGEESYRDVYEIDNAAVFTRVDREGKLPSTAAPSPAALSVSRPTGSASTWRVVRLPNREPGFPCTT